MKKKHQGKGLKTIGVFHAQSGDINSEKLLPSLL